MPNLEEHSKHTFERYGVEGKEIHKWMDEPSRKYSASHRQFRHDDDTIKLIGEIFGEKYGRKMAEEIALDHIMLDHQVKIKKRQIQILLCPKCGGSLTKEDGICKYCGYAISFPSQVFESDIRLKNNMDITVKVTNDPSLPIAIPPLHLGQGYTKTVLDDIYSDLSNLRNVEEHFLRLGYDTYTVEALRHKGYSDNDIKRLIIESKKVSKAQIKELLTRQPAHSQPQVKESLSGRILRTLQIFLYPFMSSKDIKHHDEMNLAYHIPTQPIGNKVKMVRTIFFCLWFIPSAILYLLDPTSGGAWFIAVPLIYACILFLMYMFMLKIGMLRS